MRGEGWLLPVEILAAVALLAIPYLSRSYYACMSCHARYAAIVVPVYLVLGHILIRLPPQVAWAMLAVCGFVLGIYTALFAGRYFFL